MKYVTQNARVLKAVFDLADVAKDDVVYGTMKDMVVYFGRNWSYQKIKNFFRDLEQLGVIEVKRTGRNYEVNISKLKKEIVMILTNKKKDNILMANFLLLKNSKSNNSTSLQSVNNQSDIAFDSSVTLSKKHSNNNTLLINSKIGKNTSCHSGIKQYDNHGVTDVTLSSTSSEKKQCNNLYDNKRLQMDNESLRLINKDYCINNNININNIYNNTQEIQNTEYKIQNTEIQILEFKYKEKKYKKKESQTSNSKVKNQMEGKPKKENMELFKFETESQKVKTAVSTDVVERLYKLYPSKCIVSGRSLGKSFKDKEKLKREIKNYGESYIEKAIKFKIDDCKKNTIYMPNFGTFLNNIPDITDIEDVEEIVRIPVDARCYYNGYGGQQSALYKVYVMEAKNNPDKIEFVRFDSAVDRNITADILNRVVDVVYKRSEIKMRYSVYCWLVQNGETDITLKK